MILREVMIAGLAVIATSLLSACAVYEPAPPAYAYGPGYYYYPGYYPPGYYGPPAHTSFGFVFREDRGRHRRGGWR
jgi:hypothetical protein